MSFWSEVVEQSAELQSQRQSLPPKAPTIPQAPPEQEDRGWLVGLRKQQERDGLVEQVKAATAPMTPAQSVAERFGAEPGSDIGVVSRRPGSKAAPEPSLLDLTPQQRAELVRLGTEQGRFDDNGTAKAAHEHAAMAAEATRQGAYTTTEDTTPGRWVNPRGVAGSTAGYHGHQGR